MGEGKEKLPPGSFSMVIGRGETGGEETRAERDSRYIDHIEGKQPKIAERLRNLQEGNEDAFMSLTQGLNREGASIAHFRTIEPEQVPQALALLDELDEELQANPITEYNFSEREDERKAIAKKIADLL